MVRTGKRLRPYRRGMITSEGYYVMRLELDISKVTAHGMPYNGGFIEQIHLNSTCKVYVRVCSTGRAELELDRPLTDEEYKACMEEWLFVERRQFTGKDWFDIYEAYPVISFLPDKPTEKSAGDVCGVWPCPMHSNNGQYVAATRTFIPGTDGHPVSSWLPDSLFCGFVCAFKILGEPELVMSRANAAAEI
jgi:hypothetical protein